MVLIYNDSACLYEHRHSFRTAIAIDGYGLVAIKQCNFKCISIIKLYSDKYRYSIFLRSRFEMNIKIETKTNWQLSGAGSQGSFPGNCFLHPKLPPPPPPKGVLIWLNNDAQEWPWETLHWVLQRTSWRSSPHGPTRLGNPCQTVDYWRNINWKTCWIMSWSTGWLTAQPPLWDFTASISTRNTLRSVLKSMYDVQAK